MMTLADYGIEQRAGQYKVLCPQCSSSRKNSREKCLSVDADRGIFNCHHCTFSGSLKENRREYPRPQMQPYSDNDILAAWFLARGIPKDVIERAGIALEGDKILFPYLRKGQCINIKSRGLHDKTFHQFKDAEKILYGLDSLTRVAAWETGSLCLNEAVICEGEIDVLSFNTAGVGPVVSVPDGAPAPDSNCSDKKFEYLANCADEFEPLTKIIIAVDGDEPGQYLAAELARRLGPERCWRVHWPEGCKDANDVLMQLGKDALKALVDAATPYPIDGIVCAEDLRDEVFSLYREGSQRGLSTGLRTLDDLYTVRPGEMTVVTGMPSSGKAMSLDTKIPTPSGWTTMGDIRVSDWLFDDQGKQCQVIASTDVMHGRPCYKVTFSDQTEVICDAEHHWMTRTNKARCSEVQAKKRHRMIDRPLRLRGTDQSHKRTFSAIVTTKEIAETPTVENGTRSNHAVVIAKPINAAAAKLTIPPYTLGAWLGDGTSAGQGFTNADQEVLASIRRDGYTVRRRKSTPYGYGIIGGFLPQLRELNLIHNKHIPAQYLRGSRMQRTSLLEGLMDTDGSVSSVGHCEFSSMRRCLADGVFELVASLGWVPTLNTGRAMLKGKDCGEKFRVLFTPDASVFRVTRKSQRIRTHKRPRVQRRSIVKCEAVASVPVKCIQINSPSSLYLCTKAFIPTHNSNFVDFLVYTLAERDGWVTAIFSPENFPLRRHAAKLMSMYCGRPFAKGPTERMTETHVDVALRWLQSSVVFISPPEDDVSIDTILALAKKTVLRHGIRGLVIDPWNELDHTRPPGMSETEYVSQALTKIRRFSRLHGLHIWVVVHPTKLKKLDNGFYPVASLYDCHGSAHFRNKTDNGLSIWRDINDAGTDVQIHVQKIRFREVGQIGNVTVKWEPTNGRYYD